MTDVDPNETLKRIRELVARIGVAHTPADIADLCEAIEDLDEWMSKGGFSPWSTESGENIDELVEAHERGELGLDLPAG